MTNSMKLSAGALICVVMIAGVLHAETRKFVRFQQGQTVAYGIVEGARVRQLTGDLFGKWEPTGKTFALKEVTLLVPSQPTQVFAMAGNYRSHLSDGSTTTTVTQVTKTVTDKNGNRTTSSTTTTATRKAGDVPEKFQTPQPFYKSLSSLVPNGADIVIPKGAEVVHYEAEMVVVIGRQASNVSKEAAMDYVFGVTCGNDVSARKWQKGDVQWWRAKGSDTFGPCGPYLVNGLNYDDLLMTLRLNGQTKQK